MKHRDTSTMQCSQFLQMAAMLLSQDFHMTTSSQKSTKAWLWLMELWDLQLANMKMSQLLAELWFLLMRLLTSSRPESRTKASNISCSQDLHRSMSRTTFQRCMCSGSWWLFSKLQFQTFRFCLMTPTGWSGRWTQMSLAIGYLKLSQPMATQSKRCLQRMESLHMSSLFSTLDWRATSLTHHLSRWVMLDSTLLTLCITKSTLEFT